MKRFSIHALAALLTLSLVACVSDPDGSGDSPDVLVNVTDSATGLPLAADTVHWSYHVDSDAHELHKAAHGSDTSYKAATRVDTAGTQWAIRHEGLHGAVYIRARYRKTTAFCTSEGYGVLPIQADTLPKTVTIAVPVTTVCL